jgi:hypothetical protein
MDNLKDKKLLMGIPCGSGQISAYVVDGLYKMNRPCQTSLLIIERQTPDAARNYIMEIAIKLGVDYLFFMDDDGVLPSDTLDLLLSDDKDIVGAPMLTRSERDDGTHKLCCFDKFDFYIGDNLTVNKYRPCENFEGGEYLRKVDATGGACLLIKKKCVEVLFAKYNGRPFEFAHEVHQTKEHGVTVRNISEDLNFCERAVSEGFDIWIDKRVRPVHLGKPKFVRYEEEGEKLPGLKEPLKGAITLSENL